MRLSFAPPCLFALTCLVPVALTAEEKKPRDRAKSEASAKADKPAEASKTKALPTYPAPADVVVAMKKAAAYLRSHVAFAGGYAWSWPQDMSMAHGENHESPTLIMIQPPGTPAMGSAMLTAYQATGDKLFLQAAKESAQALLWCQLASGGWGSDYDFDPRKAAKLHYRRDIEAGDTERGKRDADSTLDDQKTGAALLFLLELAHTPECAGDAALQAAVKFGLDGLIAAQAPNGGWGQHYDGPADASAPVAKAKPPAQWSRTWPGVDYTRHYTLNDGNLQSVMRLLLRAYELEKNERYLAAAKRLGDFLLAAQLPAPQPAWAQQYNREMEPAWARKFEPPAISSLESVSAINALIELWLATGDERYTAPIPAAMKWLDSVRLPDGLWARFYELGTSKALYCKAGTYEITHDDSDLPTHYGFKLEPKFNKDLDLIRERLGKTRERNLEDRLPPVDASKWTKKAKGVAAKVVTAMTAADKKTGIWLKDSLIDAGEAVKALRAMAFYVEAAKNGGAAFETLRTSPEKPGDE